LDDQPLVPNFGMTHCAFTALNNKFYMCGGYAGGNPGGVKGLTTDVCLVLDPFKPSGQQWSSTTLPKLPQGGQSGGGMVYDTAMNALFVSGGARRFSGQPTLDVDNTWMYSFANPSAGWVAKAPMPYKGNHLSFVTATDGEGNERHFFCGGQAQENESGGNKVDHYEYIPSSDTWIKHKDMPFPRGHTSSSTRPFGCGYLVIGGTDVGLNKRSDVTFYNIATDTWTKIGDLPNGLNTPVCDINRNTNTGFSTLYCETGYVSGSFSYKRQIAL
jgi:hypothetical protein